MSGNRHPIGCICLKCSTTPKITFESIEAAIEYAKFLEEEEKLITTMKQKKKTKT